MTDGVTDGVTNDVSDGGIEGDVKNNLGMGYQSAEVRTMILARAAFLFAGEARALALRSIEAILCFHYASARRSSTEKDVRDRKSKDIPKPPLPRHFTAQLLNFVHRTQGHLGEHRRRHKQERHRRKFRVSTAQVEAVRAAGRLLVAWFDCFDPKNRGSVRERSHSLFREYRILRDVSADIFSNLRPWAELVVERSNGWEFPGDREESDQEHDDTLQKMTRNFFPQEKVTENLMKLWDAPTAAQDALVVPALEAMPAKLKRKPAKRREFAEKFFSARAAKLSQLHMAFYYLAHFADLGDINVQTGLITRMLRACAPMIRTPLKRTLILQLREHDFSAQLLPFQSYDGPEFTISRFRAHQAQGSVGRRSDGRRSDGDSSNRHRDPGSLNQATYDTVFGQLFLQAFAMGPAPLRTQPGEHAFSVDFMGEGGIDAGGPFREAMRLISQELLANSNGTSAPSTLPLLIPSPNQARASGPHHDCWILNPAARSGEALALLEFLGRLIGHSVRARVTLDLPLSPIVWKQIIHPKYPMHSRGSPGIPGEWRRAALAALREHDKMASDCLSFLLSSENDGLKDDEFFLVFRSKFVTTLSDGSEAELCRGGREVHVTAKNRSRYVDLALHARMRESQLQLDALRRGLNDVFPVSAVQILTWRDVQRLVCGEPRVDIARWKRMLARPCECDEKQVAWFWQCIEGYTEPQRQAILVFAWGCKRLPMPNADPNSFRLDTGSDENKDGLPTAHTCYFTIDLPRYSSQKIMSERLIYAAENCASIDDDNSDVEREEWARLESATG